MQTLPEALKWLAQHNMIDSYVHNEFLTHISRTRTKKHALPETLLINQINGECLRSTEEEKEKRKKG